MLARSLSALIIVFWLATTGWLVRSVWFQSDAHFEPVALEEALDAFFGWNESATLTVLENGERIGQMIVNAHQREELESGESLRGISTQGTLDKSNGKIERGGGLGGTSWRMTADFDQEMEIRELLVGLRVPRQDLDIRLELTGEQPSLAARVKSGSFVLYETGTLLSDREKQTSQGKEMPPGLPVATMAPSGTVPIPGMLPGLGVPVDPAAWKPRIEASRGALELAGSVQPVYQIKIFFGEADSRNPVRLFFSEAGEPWKIDTGWGFEALAEVLIPVEQQVR